MQDDNWGDLDEVLDKLPLKYTGKPEDLDRPLVDPVPLETERGGE